jgi:hypothetical protein
MGAGAQEQGEVLMPVQETIQTQPEKRKPAVVSPELREFLHLLKSLESEPAAKPAAR